VIMRVNDAAIYRGAMAEIIGIFGCPCCYAQ